MSTPPSTFRAALQRAWAVAPTTTHGVSAMSAKRRAEILAGHDATTVLEAASTVLADIENDRFEAIAARLPTNDQRTLRAWKERVEAEVSNVAKTPVHPLALLAATTLALGQSGPGPRTEAVRELLASRLMKVGLRLNADVLEGPEGDDEAVLAYMSRSALWRAVDQEDWMIWSGELVDEPRPRTSSSGSRRRPVSRSMNGGSAGSVSGQCATSTGRAAWAGPLSTSESTTLGRALWFAPLADTVQAARNALTRERSSTPPQVPDPFDLHWLATRPIVETPDGRRFQLWLGANNRSLLPAAIAQTVADTIGERYDRVSFALGRAAERRLTRALDDLPDVDGDRRIPESAMPSRSPSVTTC